MSLTFDFSGKVALITGSSSGIGATTAAILAKSGAQVVVTGSNADRVSDVAKQCRNVSPNGQVLEVVADVTNEEDLRRLVDSTVRQFGKIDVLVNNAGAGLPIAISEPNYLDVVRRSFDINLTSALRLTQLCVPYLETTKGNVINISSVASLSASAKGSAYSMTKTALDMFTKCMAVELGQKGIRVNSVNPGVIRTKIMERRGVSDDECHKHWDKMAAKYPVGRVGEAEDIANAIAFLASRASSFTTGTILVVDGGHIAANVAAEVKDK